MIELQPAPIQLPSPMKHQVKYVFITGGVVSSLGKGITSASLALLRGCWDVEGARHIRLDALVPAQRQKELRNSLRTGRRLEKECMAAALAKLSQAKALHDALEAVYRPYMDFAALTNFTAEEIRRIFSYTNS